MRIIENFNFRWSFSKQADKVPLKLPDMWDVISLPHCWNAVDGQDGGNDYYRGTCYYAKSFSGKDLPSAGQYYLEIQGANSSATVYLNNKKLAVHHGGYSTWRVNLTDALKDADNLLVIAVNNEPNETVYPQMADFTFYGGLYRDINIICVDDSHFDLDYYGSPGIKVTPTVNGIGADIEVEVFITNKKQDYKIHYVLVDEDFEMVAEATSGETKVTLKIDDVNLWHGRKNPYMYTAIAELVSGKTIIDNVSVDFGCRTFEIDPERGFILNGEEYMLRGVSRHQDKWGKGNALSLEDHVLDMELIDEMGANTIRLAHYQHDQYFYDLCDRYGMIVWAEIPYISKHMPGGRENTVSQMRELIVQNYNHPSIVIWGLSNEISIGGSSPDLLENHKILNDMAHEIDKTRLTAVAAVSPCSIEDPYLQIPDVVSYNHYFGWYGGDADMNGPWFDKFHERHPGIPIGCSEYGCEALNWHTSNPVQGDYTEEYQAYYHEELIKQFMPRKYLWATHVWNMFDFGADARNEGGENGLNHKGLVTMDRKYKKDAFYAYKAWLSDEPFVHICGKRYIDRVEDITKVTIYSNRPEVELFANGQSLGKKTAPDHFFYFDVPNKGETELVAIADLRDGKSKPETDIDLCKDESFIRKVDVFNEKYRLKEKGAILNWFDVTESDGHFSLNDKISDVLASPEAAQLFSGFMEEAMKPDMCLRSGEATDSQCAGCKGDDKMKVIGFEVGPEMMQMIGGFTILRLSGMLGTMGIKPTKEQLLALNTQLNKIKK